MKTRTDPEQWGIWCEAIGVTGERTAWLKKNGKAVARFAVREEAEAQATALNKQMGGEFSVNRFKYSVRPL